MARHSSSAAQRTRGIRVPVAIVAVVLLVLTVGGLATWWWMESSAADPLDSAPVSATATVVTSESCLADGTTTVRLSGTDPNRLSVLDGCGFTVGQRIAVEYLAGHPESVRLAGTTRAHQSSPARALIPLAILVGGLGAAIAIGVLAVRRVPARRPGAGTVSVAELRARILAARDDGPSGQPPSGHQSGA